MRQAALQEGGEDASEALLDLAPDEDAALAKPLRAVLRAWLQAQLDYLSALPQPEATPHVAHATAQLLVPRAAMLTLDSPELAAPEEYQVSFQTPGIAFRVVALAPKDALDAAVPPLAVALGAATQFPVSNPIMCLRSWAREVFWKPPAHARPHPSTLRGPLLPQGKGWLDHELRYVLRVALPYLAVRAQPFWKSAALPPPGGVLVAGGRGSGKTALLERAAAFLAAHPATRCHVSRMSCGGMAGDKLKRVRTQIASPLNA
jgi:hypothetical protein